MTDEELIARLRVDEPMCEEHFTANLAADRIEALIAERDHWKDVAGREGVCMTCRGPRGAPEPYGCSDCLNTGYCGEYHNTVADLGAKLAKAVEALWIAQAHVANNAQGWSVGRGAARDDLAIVDAAIAELKGESHE